jgi:translation initiation factor 5A
MTTKPISVSSLKPGRYVVIDGAACVVKSIQTSRPGKHGHAKSRIEAVGIIDGVKRILIKPGHDSMESPVIEKEVAQVMSISGDIANVMDMKTYETFDLKIPEEIKDKIKEGSQVAYWIILNEKVMQQVRSEK